MFIENAKIVGSDLVLKIKETGALRFVSDFKPGEYEIKKILKKRSGNANTYCWKLASQIAEVIRLPKEDVYRRNIRDAGVCNILPIKEEAIPEFQRIWEAKGIGWFVDVADDSDIPGYKLCFIYKGSSTYTTAQMSRLIDSLIQDAQAVGIETIGEYEKRRLLDRWEK